jgi:hypothetical protein
MRQSRWSHRQQAQAVPHRSHCTVPIVRGFNRRVGVQAIDSEAACRSEPKFKFAVGQLICRGEPHSGPLQPLTEWLESESETVTKAVETEVGLLSLSPSHRSRLNRSSPFGLLDLPSGEPQ